MKDLALDARDGQGCALEDSFLKDDRKLDRLLTLGFDASPARMKLVRAVVRQAAMESGCDQDIVHDLVLAIDEACQNVIRHAYDGEGGDIEMDIRRSDSNLVIRLRDFADPVDPSRIKPRDLDEIRPGGLGHPFHNRSYG